MSTERWTHPEEVRFQTNIEREKYKWAREIIADKHAVFYDIYKKRIDLSQMGEYALKSHVKSQK